jgi:hypothetical protein
MKLLKTTLALLFVSGNTAAIVGGEVIPLVNNQDVLFLNGEAGNNCTGSLIANKYVITAGHCGKGLQVSAFDETTGANSNVVPVIGTNIHPEYTGNTPAVFDVAIWQLADKLNVPAYLNPIEPVIGTNYTIKGWGGDFASGSQLKSAVMQAKAPMRPEFSEDGFELIYGNGIGTGHGYPGDSGGPCGNGNGVWGVLQGSAGQGDGTNITTCQRLAHPRTQQWILETVNAWNYPMAVKGDGTVAVKVQNLHTTPDVVTPWVSGALQIVSNDCDKTMDPFAVCTVSVTGSGTLHLTGLDAVEVNKQVEPPQPPTPEDGGNGGGGSSSPFALALLLLVAVGRQFIAPRKGA